MFAALLFSLLLQVPRDGAQAAHRAGTASIGGVVTTGDASARVPLRRAVVSITGTGTPGIRQVSTDERGRFVFDQLPAGRFTLTVEKGGYLKTYVGSRRPGKPPSLPIVVAEGQPMLDLSIDVPRGAAIEGTVRDEHGMPQPTAQVSVAQRLIVGGEVRSVPVPGVSRVVADDRGRYRLYGLPPGDFVVSGGGGTVAINGAELATDDQIRAADDAARRALGPIALTPKPTPAPPRQYRSVGSSQDVTALRIGEERAGIDLTTSLVGVTRLNMLITAPSGQPLQNVSVGIAGVASQRVAFSPGIVRPGADGRFSLPGLSAGRYLFYGRGSEVSGDLGEAPLFLSSEVIVNGNDVEDTVLQFARGQKVTGRLGMAVDGVAPPALATARLSLTAVGGISGTSVNPPPQPVSADGSFVFDNVAPGKYRLGLTGLTGWTLSSALLEGKDTLDVPFDVRQGSDVSGMLAGITNRSTEVAGLVSDAAGRPSPEFSAVVFPADRALWTMAPRRTSGLVKIGTDGRYSIKDLPPGDYLLAVIVDADPQQLDDVGFLEQIATGAIAIRLTDGQKLIQDLKIGG